MYPESYCDYEVLCFPDDPSYWYPSEPEYTDEELTEPDIPASFVGGSFDDEA